MTVSAEDTALLQAIATGLDKSQSVCAPRFAAATESGEPSAAKRAVNDVWRQVDALGGIHDREDRESGYAEAYDAALNAAIAAVEALGGEWN